MSESTPASRNAQGGLVLSSLVALTVIATICNWLTSGAATSHWPLLTGPMTASALSCSASLRRAVTAAWGSSWASSLMISMGWPFTPPRLLIFSSAISKSRDCIVPAEADGPEKTEMRPIFNGSPLGLPAAEATGLPDACAALLAAGEPPAGWLATAAGEDADVGAAAPPQADSPNVVAMPRMSPALRAVTLDLHSPSVVWRAL